MPVTFDGYGIEVVAEGGRFLLRYDSTEGIGSQAITREISEAESVRVTRSQRTLMLLFSLPSGGRGVSGGKACGPGRILDGERSYGP